MTNPHQRPRRKRPRGVCVDGVWYWDYDSLAYCLADHPEKYPLERVIWAAEWEATLDRTR